MHIKHYESHAFDNKRMKKLSRGNAFLCVFYDENKGCWKRSHIRPAGFKKSLKKQSSRIVRHKDLYDGNSYRKYYDVAYILY